MLNTILKCSKYPQEIIQDNIHVVSNLLGA